MNTLCLENYGVSKMKTREMKEANGGAPWWKVVRSLVIAYMAVNESCDGCLNNAPKGQAEHAGDLNGGKYGGAFHY